MEKTQEKAPHCCFSRLLQVGIFFYTAILIPKKAINGHGECWDHSEMSASQFVWKERFVSSAAKASQIPVICYLIIPMIEYL